MPAFLVPNATFIVELLTFIVMLVILSKWGYPRIISAVEARQKLIEENIKSAEGLRSDAESKLEAAKKELSDAKGRAQEMLAHAKKDAANELSDARVREKQEIERMKSQAKEDIALERQQALDGARHEVAALVVTVTERVLPASIDMGSHRKLIDDTIELVTHETPAK